ncbi:MAG: trypsin-like peptidase domain-containing protein, partial [Ilumatobacteraceae bacterium]
MSSVSARRVAAGVVGLACVIGAVLIVRSRSKDGPSDSSVALRSSVRVTAFGCSRVGRIGVGAAGGDGLVATVAHVVAGSTEITVMTPDGREVPAAVVAIDRERDLAVLDVDLALPVLELGTPIAGSAGSYVVWREDEGVVVDAELTRLVSLTAPTI